MLDKETVLWLVSTAPQVLAALTGISFASLTFRLDTLDRQINGSDDLAADIQKGIKGFLHKYFKDVLVISIITIAIDIVYILICDWLFDGCEILMIMLSLFMIINLACLAFLCRFTLKLSDPNLPRIATESSLHNHLKKIGKTKDDSVKDDNRMDSKEKKSVDAGTYIIHFKQLEGALHRLFSNIDPEKRLTVREMINRLGTDRLITKEQRLVLIDINRMRNIVAHDSDINEVDIIFDNQLDECIQLINEIGEKLQVREDCQ